jgi:hypothetical protein
MVLGPPIPPCQMKELTALRITSGEWEPPQGSRRASDRATPTRRPGRSGPPRAPAGRTRQPQHRRGDRVAEQLACKAAPELELVARTDAVNEALAHDDPRAADEYRSAAATLRRQPKQHLHPKAMH